MVFVEATFPRKALRAVQSITVVLKLESTLSYTFFLFFVEESSKRAAKTIACPCRKHFGGYTAGVCVTQIYNKSPSEGLKKIRTHLDLLSIPQLGGGECQNV